MKETVFKVANTSTAYDNYVAHVNSMIDEPPTLRGYKFTGWSPTLTKDTPIKETFEQSYVANYEEATYTINFETNGGEEIDPVYHKIDEKIVEPTMPTRKHDTFSGWYKDEALGTLWDFAADTVEDDLTLYAGWDADSYSVKFMDHDDSIITSETVEYNKEVSKPSNPTQDHYTFDNWYPDENLSEVYDFTKTIEGPT